MTHDEKYQAVKAKIQELLPSKEWERDTGAPIGSGYLEQTEPRIVDVLRAGNIPIRSTLSIKCDFDETRLVHRRFENGTERALSTIEYNLTDDRLSAQSENTIDFLYQTLVANE